MAPEVQTTEGRVRGIRRASDLAFLGIPYAAAPSGRNRFLPPQPVTAWSKTFDATEFGATPQRREEPNALIPERSVPGSATLNLNVFTPSLEGAAPVLVWIHGGGYSAGSPVCSWYDGASFSRDGIVTVAISYRLGFDGFGQIDGVPANRGVRDWLAALEWVQRNIAAFGGDPQRVTIAGHSAGGGAVLTLLGMPQAQHLFRAAASISGALGDLHADLVAQRSRHLAELADVEPTLAGFRSVSEQQLTRRQYRASLLGREGLSEATAALEDGLPWAPTLDGELLDAPTVQRLRTGIGADKALLLGATDDEFTAAIAQGPRILRLVPASLGLRALARDRGARRQWLRANPQRRRRGIVATLGGFVGDRLFRSLVVRVAEARRHSPTWVYRFAWESPRTGWSGHCLDVPFWWDALGKEGVTELAGPRPPQQLADELHGALSAFVKDADPGWPTWNSEPGMTRVFGSDSGPRLSASAYDDALPLA